MRLAAAISLAAVGLAGTKAATATEPPVTVTVTTTTARLIAGCGVSCWKRHDAQHRRDSLARGRMIARLKARWRPSVDYALRLASAVFGVPYWQLHAVASCESTLNPFAVNGKYAGLLQLGWRPFGFSPFDPIASSLSTAAVVRREGWGQWQCKP